MTDFGDILTVARAHLSRIEATGDASLTLDPEIAADIEHLHEYTITPDGEANVDALYAHGMLRWYRYKAHPSSGDGVVGYAAAMMDLVYCYVVVMAPLPEALLARFADRARWAEDQLRERAEKLSERALASGDRERMAVAIDLWRRMIAPANPVHPEALPMSWSNLGVLLFARYQINGERADLDEAIEAYRKAVELETPGNPEAARSQSNLSAALYQRSMVTSSTAGR